jgi:ABC-2 type transport system permease protein
VQGIYPVFKKELADHFSSYRFIILFALIAMISVITAYTAGISLRKELEGVAKPTFVFLLVYNSPGALFSMAQFVALFGPLIGIILGFDSVNRERNAGTLSKVISQPIYRDSVINGKFLAGVVTVSIMLVSIILVIAGIALRMVGVVPGVEEVLRLIVYLIISIFYLSFWLGLSILFSILFRSVATSALASVAVWIFLTFFVSLGANVLADSLAPVDRAGGGNDPEIILKHSRVVNAVSLVSPSNMYTDAATIVIDPLRRTTRSLVLMGPQEKLSASRFQGPLPFVQSIAIIMPLMIAIVALTLVCFTVSYWVFMLQEIRT